MIFRKKKKADFSGVSSGSSSTAPAQPQQPQAAPVQPQPGAAPQASAAQAVPAPATARTHTVAKGDTLSAIAQRHYGAASKWRVIFEANRDKISDPDRIQPGQVLTIPAAQ